MKGKANFLAGTSLGIMGAGFLGTFPFAHTLAGTIFHGGFEAGLVGGLADWFAVTALFRHPMNIPIPHTALLPKNREKVTNSLVNMIENEWLTKESIASKIQEMNIAETVVTAVEKQLDNKSIQEGLTTILEQALYYIDKEKLASLIEKEGKGYLRSMDTNFLLTSVIDCCLQFEYEEKVFDYFLVKVVEWVGKEESGQLLGKITMNALNNAQQDGFFQLVIKSLRNFLDEEKLGTALQNALVKGLPKLNDSGNENRNILLHHLRKGLRNIKYNEEVIGNLGHWKDDALNHLDMKIHIIQFLENVQGKAVQFIRQEAFYEEYCLPFLVQRINDIKGNPMLMAKIESWIQTQITSIIEKNHGKIGSLVKENLSKLDNETLTYMIENNVGKELQWIRVNGAICGFIIGIGLEVINLIL